MVPAHGEVIVSEGSGDEVLRGEDVVARKPVPANCPPPLRPGPASSCLVTAINCNETMRQGIDARLSDSGWRFTLLLMLSVAEQIYRAVLEVVAGARGTNSAPPSQTLCSSRRLHTLYAASPS